MKKRKKIVGKVTKGGEAEKKRREKSGLVREVNMRCMEQFNACEEDLGRQELRIKETKGRETRRIER